MKVGYARVSTRDQNLDLQIDALRSVGCEKIFTDNGVSGARLERDGLNQALRAIGEGDVLVVWKLDRLGRSLGFLAELIASFSQKGLGFQAIQDGIDTTTPNGKLIFHIMACLAEFERDLIRERTIAGLQAAKRRGKRIGRPPLLTEEQITLAYYRIQRNEKTVSGMAKTLGVHRNTLKRAINKKFGL